MKKNKPFQIVKERNHCENTWKISFLQSIIKCIPHQVIFIFQACAQHNIVNIPVNEWFKSDERQVYDCFSSNERIEFTRNVNDDPTIMDKIHHKFENIVQTM